VKDGIFIGTVHAALDPGFIFTNKITHIVNCAGANVMNRWEGMGIRYLTFNWADTDVSIVLDPKDVNINRICEFCDEALDNAEGVLIHSVRGSSRSCTVLVAYLVKKYGWPVDVALDFIRRKRPEVNPKPAFVRQLKTMRKRLVRRRNQQREPIAPAEDEVVLKNTYLNSMPQAIGESLDSSRSRNAGRPRLSWFDLSPPPGVVPPLKGQPVGALAEYELDDRDSDECVLAL
jgi:predicted protein tyrosine phosphatase